MELGIRQRVAIVTGGSRGLGREIALGLAGEGCRVIICARGEDDLRKTLAELRSKGNAAAAIVTDVTKPADLDRLFQDVIRVYERVDILVNNAGGGAGEPNLADASMEDLRLAFEKNLWPALYLTKLVLPGMREHKWGRIINISSIYGREYGGGIGYMMAKTAMIAMTKHLGEELASENILANSVAPGSIAFPGGRWERWQQTQPPEVIAEFIKHNLPMGKIGWPQPVAALVAFLASDRADLITAAAINVDGGQSKSLL